MNEKILIERLDDLYDSVNESQHGDIRGQVLKLIEVVKSLVVLQAFIKCAGCGQRFDAFPNKSHCPDCEAESARTETLTNDL